MNRPRLVFTAPRTGHVIRIDATGPPQIDPSDVTALEAWVAVVFDRPYKVAEALFGTQRAQRVVATDAIVAWCSRQAVALRLQRQGDIPGAEEYRQQAATAWWKIPEWARPLLVGGIHG